jgi:hypothetical protein
MRLNGHDRSAQKCATDATKAAPPIYKELQEEHYKKYNYNAAPIGIAGNAATNGGGEWIFPNDLLPEERDAAAKVLLPHPDMAQVLLDELAARLQAGAIQTSPITFLKSLVLRVRTGTFVAEFAPRVALARKRMVQASQGRREETQAQAHEHAMRDTPEYRAKIAKRRAEMREFLKRSRSLPPREES